MLKSHPEVSVVSSQVELFLPQSSGGHDHYMDWQNQILSPEQHDLEIWIEQTICNPAATFRNKSLDDVGGYQESPFLIMTFVRLNVAGHLQERPQIGHYWRRHGLH